MTDAISNEHPDGASITPVGTPSAQSMDSLGQSPQAAEALVRSGWLGRLSWASIRRSKWLVLIELAAIVAWALYFTRPYLDMDPTIVPSGREYLSAIQTHTVWQKMSECGLCALWYGNERGGFPAFADPVASTLHPLVILTTVIWGVVNGSKVALVALFALAGLSQWWLGYLLGLRWPSRVWASMMAVVAGYLAARMDLGAFSLLLSTASAVVVFPAMIHLARRMDWRGIMPLAVVLALLAVGGTGYIQIGLVFVLPAAIFLVPWNRQRLLPLLKASGLAIGLAVLFAGPFLVPFLHFLPQLAKDSDITFSNAQPLAYVPLNLVIHDIDFYLSDALGKAPWPSHFVNFVGWIPVLLAGIGLFGGRGSERRREITFLAVAAAMSLWIASSMPLAWIVKVVKLDWISQLIGGVRYTSFMASLAIPPILGLAGIGLDRLLGGKAWRLRMGVEGGGITPSFALDLRWFLLIPLVFAVNQARSFSNLWIGTKTIDPYVPRVLDALRTPGLEWVNVPFGEHFFVTPAVVADLKLSGDFFRTWHWKDRPIPPPLLEASRGGPPGGMVEQTVVEGIHIHVADPAQEYASVEHADGTVTACQAQGIGGDIGVLCESEQGGTLVVEENSWSGWKVSVDGEPADLLKGNWLSVEAPAGSHTYVFRYRPWDVLLGLFFLLAGVAASAWLIVMGIGEDDERRSSSLERGSSEPQEMDPRTFSDRGTQERY